MFQERGLADRVAILEKGRVAWTGPASALTGDPGIADRFLDIGEVAQVAGFAQIRLDISVMTTLPSTMPATRSRNTVRSVAGA